MIELLKLCGYEEKEIASELPRIKKAFDKLGINAEDIERAKQRLHKYYEIELKGTQKVFRLIVRELVDSLLLRDDGDKKVIYGFMCPGIDLINSALVSKSSEVCAIYHSWAFQIVVGCVFGKIVPIIEEAEKLWLKDGVVAHCANVKTLVGPIVLGLFPKPDLLVTAGFMCETAPKTLDLLHELYNIPVWYIDNCQDRGFREFPEPSRRIASLTAKSMKSCAGRIQEIVGFEITDDMLREVQKAKDNLNGAIGRLKELVSSSDPFAVSPANENVWGCLNSLALTVDGLAEATEAINLLYEEVREKVAKGLGVVEKGAPRVLVTLPMGQTDPSLEQLACEVGIVLLSSMDRGMKVTYKDTSEDPYMKFGLDSQQKRFLLKNRIPMMIEGCRNMNIDGVLDRFHVGCRMVAADAMIIASAIKKELGIPVLVLEWENFDPRAYDHMQFKNRFEVFKSMMVENKKYRSR